MSHRDKMESLPEANDRNAQFAPAQSQALAHEVSDPAAEVQARPASILDVVFSFFAPKLLLDAVKHGFFTTLGW